MTAHRWRVILSTMTITFSTSAGLVSADLIDERPFGWIARAPTGALYLLHGMSRGYPLVAGPSFFRLLSSLPDGSLPRETAAVAAALLDEASEPRPLRTLRFDVTTSSYRWEGRVTDASPRARDDWRASLCRRLFTDAGDGIRPRVEALFDTSRDRLPTPTFADLDERALAAGRRHLEELTRVVLRDEVEQAEQAVEEWRLLPETDRSMDRGVEDRRSKAWHLLAQAEADALAGRPGAARMNARLAEIYAANPLSAAGPDLGLKRFVELLSSPRGAARSGGVPA